MKQIEEARETGCIGIKAMNELIDKLERQYEERKAILTEFDSKLCAM